MSFCFDTKERKNQGCPRTVGVGGGHEFTVESFQWSISFVPSKLSTDRYERIRLTVQSLSLIPPTIQGQLFFQDNHFHLKKS